MESVTVLLTGVGAPGADSIINCLRYNGERDIKLVGIDMNPFAPCRAKVDIFYQTPAANDPLFIERVLEICKKEEVDVLIPIVTRELEKFAKEKHRFAEAGTKVSVMDEDALYVANNKGRLLSAIRDAGYGTPLFKLVETPKELEDAITEMGYPQNPVVVKPCFGNGSRGIRFLDAHRSRYEQLFNEKPNSQFMRLEEYMSIIAEKNSIPEMVVMEFLSGQEICVDVLADKGDVLYISSRVGQVVNSIMISNEVKLMPKAIELVKKVVALLELDGNIDFDIKEDKEGDPFILEINPRLPSGIAVEAIAGINFPYLRIKQLLNEKLPTCSVVEGTKMQFYNSEIFFAPDGTVLKWGHSI